MEALVVVAMADSAMEADMEVELAVELEEELAVVSAEATEVLEMVALAASAVTMED